VPQVIFIHPDESREEHTVKSGESIMDCALDNRVDGIKAQCGGGANCSTCHCYVESPWSEQLPACTEDENDLLAFVWQRKPNSRLACQLIISDKLDGILVRLPKKQV
jgi:2Fe-2S ferredoxin